MLKIETPRVELYDDANSRFVYIEPKTLVLEHSLVSISKWEAKWKKPYLDPRRTDKSIEEVIDYIRCMTITQNVDPVVYTTLSNENFREINEYINDSRSATWFSEKKGKPNSTIITSELIYYWMISFGIPFECQKWHLNRLLTLIRICMVKNGKNEKMSMTETYSLQRELNERRRAEMHSKG